MNDSQKMGDDEAKAVMLSALTAFGPSGVKKVLEGMEGARKVIAKLKARSTLIDELSDEELLADRSNENPNAGETDTQEGPSAEDEVVAWRVKDFADGWTLMHSEYEARQEAEGAGNLIEPLVCQSDLTACQQEVKRLREYLAWYGNVNSDLDVAEARILELEKALEFYRDKAFIPKANPRYGGLEWMPTEALFDDCGDIARTALGGQSNG